MPPTDEELVAIRARREELRDRYLLPPSQRPATPGRGIHHAALICSDVETTIGFYQGLLGFFDFPGLGLEPGVEALGGVQHIAISVPQDRWDQLRATLDEAGVPYDGPQRGIPESMYLRDPDGIGIELLSDPLMFFGGKQLDVDEG